MTIKDTNPILYMETIVVASALLHRADFEAARSTGLLPSDFTESWLGRIWGAALTLAEADAEVDLVSVAERLMADHAFDSSPSAWMADMVALVTDVSTTVYAPKFARRLRRRSAMRRQVKDNLTLLTDAGSGEADPGEVRDWAQEVARDLADTGKVRFRPAEDEMASLDSADHAYVPPIPTGFKDLDCINPGFTPGSQVLVAGRTSTGKTCLMLDFSRHAARTGRRVAIVSLEMSMAQVSNRLLAAEASLPTLTVTSRGWSGEEERERFTSAAARIAGWKMHLLDTPTIDLQGLRAVLLGLYPRPDMVVLDYLGLMARRRAASTNDAVSELSRGLKVLASELECVMLVGSQLSRSSAHDERPPELHDLRDSGSLEQDADAVLMLDRWYEEIKGPNGKVADRIYDNGRRMIYWRKMRDGRIGQADMRFWAEMTTFAPVQ